MPPEASIQALLKEGAGALGWPVGDQVLLQLERYLELLAKWNRTYNLTSVRDPVDMLRLHVLDSMSIALPLSRRLQGRDAARVLDVGSGAGLPGVVLAVLFPQLTVVCVDTVGKKARFVQQVQFELGLANLRAVQARVEDMDDGLFDVVVSRAFASLTDFVSLTHGLLAPGACWLAMKGKRPNDELEALSKFSVVASGSIDVFHVEQVQVPGVVVERTLVWMSPREVA